MPLGHLPLLLSEGVPKWTCSWGPQPAFLRLPGDLIKTLPCCSGVPGLGKALLGCGHSSFALSHPPDSAVPDTDDTI